jgi:DNA-binding NarL/FixJ family response regulator
LHKRSLSSLGPDTLGLHREDKILLRIMVVDDDEMVRSSTCRLLNSYPDIEVVCEGSDGAEAVTKARGYLPDVILMDIRMPTMNGLEATRIIKREIPSIQIIVVSGQDALREALSAGANGYLMKTEVGTHLVTELQKVRALKPLEG